MLAEMLEKIEGMAVAAKSLTKLYETPRKAVYDRNGTILEHAKDRPARSHAFLALPDLVSAIADYDPDGKASVWVSEGLVVVTIDDCEKSYRDDTLRLAMIQSPFFAVLQKALWLDQKQIVDLLRHDLCGAVIDPPETLNSLKQLKFSTATEQTGTLTNTSAATGKSAMSEVTGAGALPETVKVEFCSYPALRDVLNTDVTVDCTLFADAPQGKLKLAPRPGEMEAAKLVAMQAVQEWIRGKTSVPVHLGVPT